MREKVFAGAGLLVFVAVVTAPGWYGRAAGTKAQAPALQRAEQGPQCVLPTGTMRERHMALLVEWRDLVVRQHVRSYAAPDGRVYKISLSKTCLENCHTSKAQFCDRCHAYADVSPYCWDCHVDPGPGAARRSQP